MMNKEFLYFCLAATSLAFAFATWDVTFTTIMDGYDPWWMMLVVGLFWTMCFIYLAMKSGRLWLKERDERILREVLKDE